MSGPMLWTALAVALGGAIGSVARWLTTLALAPLGWPIAAGTLAVNLLGGLCIGASIIWFGRYPNDMLRLALVTGLLGGLTTFSAFSAESLTLLVRGQWMLALTHSLLHVGGSLMAATAGWWLARQWWA